MFIAFIQIRFPVIHIDCSECGIIVDGLLISFSFQRAFSVSIFRSGHMSHICVPPFLDLVLEHCVSFLKL